MKLALLGADDESLDFLEFELCDEDHQLVAAYDVGSYAGRIRECADDVVLGEDWESLLLGTRVDLVIIARGQAHLTDETGIPDAERRAEQLRKLAQAAVPMVVFVPACEAIVGFEIEMIRRDAGGVIIAHNPGLASAARFQAIIGAADESPIGRVEQLLFEREMETRSRANVLTAFARDVAIVRELLGQIGKVMASGPPSPSGLDPLGPKSRTPPSLANLSVHLQGECSFAGRWSVGPVLREPGAWLTLVGSHGRAMITMPAGGEDRTYEIRGMQCERWIEPTSNREPTFLSGVRPIVEGKLLPESNWLASCRDQEVAEAVDRSLARGRTIELFGEEHTEEDSFKGVMAVGGCLLLMMAVGVVFVATVVEGLRLPLRDWQVWNYWPIYLLVPVVVFLLLQLLQVVIKRDESSLRQMIQGDGPGN